MSDSDPIIPPSDVPPERAKTPEGAPSLGAAKKPAGPEAPDPAPAKPKRRRTWKHRLKITVIVAVLLVLAFRVAINLLLPTVVRKVANVYDLDCTYKSMDLSLLGGNARIWNLTLRPKAGGQSIVEADYVQGLISPWALFRGRLVVWRAEVDGVNVLIDRERDGSIPLLKTLIPASGASSAKPVVAASGTPRAINLQAPLRVDAVRLSHVTARFRDLSVTPVFEATMLTTLRISDVGSALRPARFELETNVDPLLDTLRIEGEAHDSPTALTASATILMRGLHLRPAAAYLAPLGLKPLARSITIQAHLNLTADSIANSPDIRANLALTDVNALADGEQWASLGKLTLNAKKLSAGAAELGELLISDGSLSARRAADGSLRIAGIKLAPASTTAKDASAKAPTATPAVAAATATPPATANSFRFSLDQIRLKNLSANFDDQAVSPAANLLARLDDLTVKNIVLDPKDPGAEVAVAGSFNIPGVIQSIRLVGSAAPFAAQRQLHLQITGAGVKPVALKPYLDAAGIESQFKDGSFAASLDATAAASARGVITASARLSKIHLDDGKPLIEFAGAKIDQFTFDPASGALGVGSINVSGPSLQIHRGRDGSLSAAGFRTLAAKAATPGDGAATPTASAIPPVPVVAKTTAKPFAFPAFPPLKIGAFTWNGVHLSFIDEQSNPPQTIDLADAGVEVKDLTLDLQSNAAQSKPGSFRAWLSAPRVAQKLEIDGTLAAEAHKLTVQSAVTGAGLTAAALASYLRGVGVEPVLKTGTLRLKSLATLAIVNGRLQTSLDLTDLHYNDGAAELAGVDAVRLDGLGLAPTGLTVDHLTITRPRAAIVRNADGSLEAGGIRLISTEPPRANPAAAASAAIGASDPADAPLVAVAPAPAGKISPPAAFHLPPLPITLAVKALNVDDASIAWTDRAAAPPVQTRATISVKLANMDVGPNSKPTTVSLTAKVDGAIDHAAVNGALTLAPQAPSAQLSIVADGVRAGPLAAYLPPGVRSTLRQGHFAAAIDAGLSNNPAGGLAAHFSAQNLKWQDSASGTTWAAVDSFKLTAPRIDPAGGVIALDELSSAGVTADVRRTPGGALQAMGLEVAAPQPANTDAKDAAVSGAAPAAGDAPVLAAGASPAPAPSSAAKTPAPMPVINAAAASAGATRPVENVAALMAEARRPLPLVTIKKLALNLTQLRIEGMAGPDAAPITIAGARLVNVEPIAVGGMGAGHRPPVRLLIDGGIQPVVSKFAVAVQAEPLAMEPAVDVDVKASGIDGKGLTDAITALRPLLNGTALTDGTFHTHLTAAVDYGRRGPRDLDLSRGFKAHFDVKPLEFRATPNGRVVAGLEEIRGDGIKVNPRHGDVLIKSIEITQPIARIVREKDGLHVLGMVVPLATSPSAPSARPKTPPAEVATKEIPKAPQAVAGARPKRPRGQISLDRLTVSGINVFVEDQTTLPYTIIPLKTLDIEVRDLSNQMPWTGKPMRFNMLCTSGNVALPPRPGASGRPATRRSTQGAYTELRPLFSQVTANAKIGIRQTKSGDMLDGWATTSVNGFELLGIRGIAQQEGITIGGGIFDDTNEFRFDPEGTINTKNRIVFTDLSLSEPANGPLQRLFKLPAPIDVAIGAVTDSDGSITMNVPVPIKNGSVKYDEVIFPAIGAVGGVLMTGITSAPVKAIGGVGKLLGITGPAPKPRPPVVIQYPPGYVELSPADLAALNVIKQNLLNDDHLELQIRSNLSAGDVALARARANPSQADCQMLAERVRRQKEQLLARRSVLAAEARGDIGSHSPATAVVVLQKLKAVDRELAQAEDSLDQLYGLLGPGAAAQADWRTRAASLYIARTRLAAVNDVLRQSGIQKPGERIHLTNPRYEPSDSAGGGTVVVTLVPKRH